MSKIQVTLPSARAQEAQRAEWHRRHPEASGGRPKPKPQEESVDRTRLLRLRDWTYVHLLLIQKRGLIRHLSHQTWKAVFWSVRKLWDASMWVRGAYKYTRWRLSPYEKHSAPLLWKRLICEGCDWRAVVDDVAYCDACNCPKTPRAALARKNRRTYPHCPKGKHPGSKVDPYAKMQPCFGCGGRKRNGNTEMGT